MDGYLKKLLLLLVFAAFQEAGAIQFRFLGNLDIPFDGLVGPLPAGVYIGPDGLWWGNAMYEAGVTSNHELYQRIAQILDRDEDQLQVFFVGGPNAEIGAVFNFLPNNNVVSQVHLAEPIGNPVLMVTQPIEDVVIHVLEEIPHIDDDNMDIDVNDMEVDYPFGGAGA